jgi:hypothetical protein
MLIHYNCRLIGGITQWLEEANKGLRPKIKLMHVNGHEKGIKRPQRSSLRYLYPSEGYTLLGPRYDHFYDGYYALLPHVHMCFSSFEGDF